MACGCKEDGIRGGVVGCVGQSSKLWGQRNKLSLQRTEQNKRAAHYSWHVALVRAATVVVL
jgi:hypothetical protein